MQNRADAPQDQRTLIPGPNQRCVRILIVDDYADNVNTTALLLRRYGHQVDTALSGRTAISQAAASKPDIALIDISMPVMDGYEVATHLRDMYHENIILIALTAKGSEEDQQRSIQAGFNRHLLKPADPKKLAELIQELTGSL